MDDLTVFLAARLDEDEAAAREAIADPGMAAEWNETTSGCLDVGLPDHGGEYWGDYVWPQGDRRVTRFIARHDPARVLREVEAKRAILKAYEWVAAHKADGGGIERDYNFRSGQVISLETAIRFLAAVWSDHPDYRQEWKP
jgi:Family of unknown function (DUF6221)